nr:hypothetical protein [Tanacetum cinerariifolium]
VRRPTNLEKGDAEMTDANPKGSEQQNVSQESIFEQEEEDTHLTLTPVSDAQKADELVQSSSVSFYFTSKFINLKNPSPTDNEIASLMETSASHATAIPELTFKRGDGVAIIKRRRQDLHRDGVKDPATASGRGRLKEDLESTTWRQRHNFKVTPSRHFHYIHNTGFRVLSV